MKRGKGKEVLDHRRVTLALSLYKVYAMVVAERLRQDVEGRKLIPPNQTGFRREMGTMDNVYVLNYLLNRQISK